MKHGSLFSGIGGFDLAAQWMGWENILQVEIDTWCQKLLKQHYPNVQRFTDIREFDGRQFAGQLDIISGGFPCQPYSTAGERKGKEDSRHLWPQMFRVIREIQPRWIVGENVRGLINWNGGMVFDEVQSDLESAGYEVQPFLLPAAGCNAPHERYRIWFVAHAIGKQTERENEGGFQPFASGSLQDVANPNSTRRGQLNAPGLAARPGQYTGRDFDCWDEWTTKPAVCGVDDGVPNRVHRIKGLGNAVVPQVVYRIFQIIEQYENETNN